MKHQLLTAAIALASVAVALAAGSVRKAALVGATISGFTALGSIMAMGRAASARKPMQAAVAVMAAAFLLRIVLVAVGTILVGRGASNPDIYAFVAAFFVPYFVYAAVEAAFLNTLRGAGPTA